MALEGKVVILNLRDGDSVNLRFPEKIKTADSINYDDVDASGGAKPLIYGNRNPQQVTLDQFVLDNTHSRESCEPMLKKISDWRNDDAKNGSPPPLQIITAQWNARVVLTDLDIEREFFTTEGVCLRARLNLTFKELRATRGLTIAAQKSAPGTTKKKRKVKRHVKTNKKNGRRLKNKR